MSPSKSFHLTSPQFISLFNYLLMFSLMFSPGCLVINFLSFYDQIVSPWIQINCCQKSDRLTFAELGQLLIDRTDCACSLGINFDIFLTMFSPYVNQTTESDLICLQLF